MQDATTIVPMMGMGLRVSNDDATVHLAVCNSGHSCMTPKQSVVYLEVWLVCWMVVGEVHGCSIAATV